MKRQRSDFVLCTLLALPALLGGVLPTPAAFAQTDQLQVSLTDGANRSYAVVEFGGTHYVSLTDVRLLLQALDAKAEARWDASTGMFRARLRGTEFSLDQNQSVLRYGDAIIDVARPLLAAQGRVYVPADSLERVLRPLKDVRTNISQWVSTAPPPTVAPAVPPPGATESPLGTPPGAGALSDLVLPMLSGQTPGPAASALQNAATWRPARLLVDRAVVVLDPQVDTAPAPSTASAMPLTTSTATPEPGAAEVTWRVAERCKQILESGGSLQVVLTRDAPAAAPSLQERLRVINGARGKALLCLRLDASPFPANAGYRLYAMHERIDPLASRSREIHASGPLPPELAYLPYEGLSAVLAGLADTELARGGLSPAPEKIGVAPLYLLKRADLPSALVTLGYRTNDKERARMADTGFVESAARSLAQALLEFDRQLRSVTETN